MDSDLTLDFIIIIVLIIANGLFSMTELAIVNAKKRKLEELAESGNERAKTAFELSENPNEMFSTIQIGITLVGTGKPAAEQIAIWQLCHGRAMSCGEAAGGDQGFQNAHLIILIDGSVPGKMGKLRIWHIFSSSTL